MPLYTFINKNTNEEYDEVMSYEALLEYVKRDDVEQVFKIKITRYSDAGGMKDQFTDWCKDNKVKDGDKGNFKPYGKATKGFKEGKNG
jgi:hypothetical protein